jgi:hypothetical protein
MCSNIDDDDNCDLVSKAIKNKPGCTYNDLINDTSLEKVVLSKALHSLIHRVSIFKRDNFYYPVDVDKALIKPEVITSSVSKDAVRMAELRTLTKKTKLNNSVVIKEKTDPIIETKKENTPIKEKIYGNLRRKGEKAIIAMFLYKNRNSGIFYSIKDIKDALSPMYTLKDAANILWCMNRDKIIEEFVEEGKRKAYKWSGRLIYPFNKVEPEDDLIIPRSICNNKLQSLPKVTKSNIPTLQQIDDLLHIGKLGNSGLQQCNSKAVEEKHSVILSMINLRIELIESELKHLFDMKAILETS